MRPAERCYPSYPQPQRRGPTIPCLGPKNTIVPPRVSPTCVLGPGAVSDFTLYHRCNAGQAPDQATFFLKAALRSS